MVTAVKNDNILSPNDGRSVASGNREAQQLAADSKNQQADSTTTQATQQPAGSVDVARASQLYNQAELSPSPEGAINTPQQAEELATEISLQFSDDAEGALRSHSGTASTTLVALLENAPT